MDDKTGELVLGTEGGWDESRHGMWTCFPGVTIVLPQPFPVLCAAELSPSFNRDWKISTIRIMEILPVGSVMTWGCGTRTCMHIHTDRDVQRYRGQWFCIFPIPKIANPWCVSFGKPQSLQMLNEICWLSSNENYFCHMRGGEENLTGSSEKTINRLQRGTGTVKALLQENNWEMMGRSGYYKHMVKLNNKSPQNTVVWWD